MRYFVTIDNENQDRGYVLEVDGKRVPIPYEILFNTSVLITGFNTQLGAQLALSVNATHENARLYLNGNAQNPDNIPAISIFNFSAE